jgi:hypothetical protein
MNALAWFGRHLHWTYLFGIMLAVATPVLILSIAGPAAKEQADRMLVAETYNGGLRIYLDPAYATEWSDTVPPNLNALKWTSSAGDWRRAVLTVYLDNTSERPLRVTATPGKDKSQAGSFFDVASDVYTVSPGARTAMNIKLSQASWYSGTPVVWFQIEPDTGRPLIQTLYPLALALGLALGLAITWWVLWRKGQSYWWLMLAVTILGIAAVFSLKNERELNKRMAIQAR